jgi:hypothetical protein
LGQDVTQAGNFPFLTMSGQKSHLLTVPIFGGVLVSGEYGCLWADLGIFGSSQLKTLDEYGHAAMQNLQPMQRSLSISTIPSVRLKVAPTGHTLTQGGLLQWRQGLGNQ